MNWLEILDKPVLIEALIQAIGYINENEICPDTCKYRNTRSCPRDCKNSDLCQDGILLGLIEKAKSTVEMNRLIKHQEEFSNVEEYEQLAEMEEERLWA